MGSNTLSLSPEVTSTLMMHAGRADLDIAGGRRDNWSGGINNTPMLQFAEIKVYLKSEIFLEYRIISGGNLFNLSKTY